VQVHWKHTNTSASILLYQLPALSRNKKGETFMEIKATTTAGGAELILTGRLDTVTSTKLQTALTEAIGSSETVALDFAGVEYVSSAGLRVLLQGQKTAQASEKSMTLKNVSSDVMEVFEITGFSGILTIV